MAKLNSMDKKYQAENDAYTMAKYEEIMADTARRNAAIKAAKEQAADLNKRANAMSKVASGKTPSKTKKK